VVFLYPINTRGQHDSEMFLIYTTFRNGCLEAKNYVYTRQEMFWLQV